MSLKPARVLVVDDDELLRLFYTRALSSFGYQAVCAGDGEQAITLLQTSDRPFSLIIMDLLMPVKTGWEAIAFIRKQPEWSQIPIVAVTGVAISDEELERITALCDGVIRKRDFAMDKLRAILDTLIPTPDSSS